ncbi:hypothetical protein AB0B31_35425 [Catellatospora citrea]|uniref:hypothetical protein n=1 Tax=Catellatospora citrea TaxID=53366 RepID=UPI0033CE9324
MTAIEASWAWHGKLPGSRDGFKVLACSDGAGGRQHYEPFVRLLMAGEPRRKATGADALPWVAFGCHDPAWTVVTVCTASDHVDGSGARIYPTSLYCFPFDRDAKDPIGYASTYRALPALPNHDDAPVTVVAEPWDTTATARRIDDNGLHWFATAAALVARGPLAIVGDVPQPIEDRLEHLDAIVALLPYGCRARLLVGSWADGTSRHQLRLSFGAVAGDGRTALPWRTVPEDSILGPAAALRDDIVAAARLLGTDRLVAYLAGLRKPVAEPDGEVVRAALEQYTALAKPLTSPPLTQQEASRALDSLQGRSVGLAPAAHYLQLLRGPEVYPDLVLRDWKWCRDPVAAVIASWAPGDPRTRAYAAALAERIGDDFFAAVLSAVATDDIAARVPDLLPQAPAPGRLPNTAALLRGKPLAAIVLLREAGAAAAHSWLSWLAHSDHHTPWLRALQPPYQAAHVQALTGISPVAPATLLTVAHPDDLADVAAVCSGWLRTLPPDMVPVLAATLAALSGDAAEDAVQAGRLDAIRLLAGISPVLPKDMDIAGYVDGLRIAWACEEDVTRVLDALGATASAGHPIAGAVLCQILQTDSSVKDHVARIAEDQARRGSAAPWWAPLAEFIPILRRYLALHELREAAARDTPSAQLSEKLVAAVKEGVPEPDALAALRGWRSAHQPQHLHDVLVSAPTVSSDRIWWMRQAWSGALGPDVADRYLLWLANRAARELLQAQQALELYTAVLLRRGSEGRQ